MISSVVPEINFLPDARLDKLSDINLIKSSMKPITKVEFEVMMDEVADNLKKAYFHIKLYQQLEKELRSSENLEIYSNSRIFWDRTLDAHYQVGIMALMKVYDFRNDNDVVTIKAILNDIKSYHTFWNKASLDSEQIKHLEEDISYVNRTDKQNNGKNIKTSQINEETGVINPSLKPVDKLNNIRDRKIAHSGKQSGGYKYAKIVARYQKINEALNFKKINDFASSMSYEFFKDCIETNLSLDEVIQLINEGIQICNRYREIFDMPTITPSLDGDEDYKNIFALT